MENRPKTDLQLPRLLFGTSALGNLYMELEEEKKLEIIQNCFLHSSSPVVFDCAGKYGAGLALEMLGKSLKQLRIKPADVIISNKLGWLRKPLIGKEPTFEPGVWHGLKHDAEQQISYDGILACWEQGNELLGGEYSPQLVSVHDPDEYINQAENEKESDTRYQDILEAYKALYDLKSQGKVKAIGIGAKDWRIIQHLSEQIEFDWVMLANSYTLYSHPAELSAFMNDLNKKGTYIINSAVFNAGFLVGGKYFDYRLVESDNQLDAHLFKWRNSFFNICETYDVKPSHACIQFGLKHPAVSSIALNTSKPENIIRNIHQVENSLPPDFYKRLMKEGLIDPEIHYLY